MTDTREAPERALAAQWAALLSDPTYRMRPGDRQTIAALLGRMMAGRADLPRDEGLREGARVLLDLLSLPENAPRLVAAIQTGEAADKDGGSRSHAFLFALAADTATPEELHDA